MIIGILILIAVLIGFFGRRMNKKLPPAIPSSTFSLVSLETLFIYVLPFIGIAMGDAKCADRPLATGSALTAHVLWITFVTAYAASRHYKQKLSPLALLFASSGITAGILFCLVFCIHFSNFLLLLLFPGLNLLYISPLVCLVYFAKENYRLHLYLREQLAEARANGAGRMDAFYRFLQRYRLGVIILLIMPLLHIIQALLNLLGQRPGSIILQFTESCGFMLSSYQHCSCGGGHYLCSIAASGSAGLVKPSRFGIRQGQRIVVNRQLLIANAFENWLEDHCPDLHRVIRNAYDSCNIPVNRWSKHRRFANVLYVLMKPLEWLFLLWLYLFDRHPEDRIARQYFPKDMIDNYIKTRI